MADTNRIVHQVNANVSMESMNRLKDLRKSKGLTQKDIAERFDIPLGTYCHWEQGVSAPPDYVFNMMIELLS